MPLRSETSTDALDELMPQSPMPTQMVWLAAAVLAGLALIGLVMGLRQSPGGGPSAFGMEIGESPAAASASASPAKPLAGDKWSTLSGPQIAPPASDTAAPKTALSAAPSGQAPAARSAAAAAAPPDVEPPTEAAPAAPPSPPKTPARAPANNGSQPDSMQNYY